MRVSRAATMTTYMEFKVLRTIVCPVAILVMHRFVRLQKSTEYPLHD